MQSMETRSFHCRPESRLSHTVEVIVTANLLILASQIFDAPLVAAPRALYAWSNKTSTFLGMRVVSLKVSDSEN